MCSLSVTGREVSFCFRQKECFINFLFLSIFCCCLRLKKISACCVESNGENLLIGTENGNIYVMDLLRLEMTDSVIYLDVVMQK